MAATAILRSQDCLLRHQPSNTFHYQNSNFAPPPQFESSGRDDHHRTVPVSYSPRINNLVMGQVRILKRREALPKTTPSEDNKATAFAGGGGGDDEDLTLCSTGRLGPEPETVQKEIKVPDLYAGVGPFVESPPPSSLPFPAFFAKKEKNNDVATSDLRRLLKLDMVA